MLLHPTAVAILRELEQLEEASPASIARRIGEPVNRVGYHARRLQRVGAITQVREVAVRGATAHIYRLSDAVRAERPLLFS